MNGNMSLDEFKKTIEGVTLDSFIEECKKKYMIERLMQDPACDANKFNAALMMEGLMDRKFEIQMTHLSMELFAGLVYQKLKEE